MLRTCMGLGKGSSSELEFISEIEESSQALAV
jgi:hypothetical protein